VILAVLTFLIPPSRYVKYLQYLDVLPGDDFEYLNPKGVIPTCAILKVGEQVRAQPNKKGEKSGEKSEEVKQESDDEEDLLKGNSEEFEG
jgi:hypothetical protein